MFRLLLQTLTLLDNKAKRAYAAKGMGVPQPESRECGLIRGPSYIKPKMNPCIRTTEGAGTCCSCMWGDSIRARNDETAARRAEYNADPKEWVKKHGKLYKSRQQPPESLPLKKEDPVPIEAFNAHLPIVKEKSVLKPGLLEKYLIISYACQLTVTDAEADSILPYTTFPRSADSRYAARMTNDYLVLCPKSYIGIKLVTPSQRRYDPFDRRSEMPAQMVTSARCVSPEEYAQLTIDHGSPPELLDIGAEPQQSEPSQQLEDDPDEAARRVLKRKHTRERDRKRRMRAEMRVEASKRIHDEVTCLEIPVPQLQTQLAASDKVNPAIVPEGPETTPVKHVTAEEQLPTRHMQLVVGVVDSSMADATVEALNAVLQSDGHFQSFLDPDIPIPFGEAMNAANYGNFSELDAVFDAMPQAFMSLHHTTMDPLGISNTRALELNNGIRADQVVVDTALWSDMPRPDHQDHVEACFTPVYPGSLNNADAYIGFQNLYLPEPKP